ncbi:MAG: Lrp/AsnC family transcriptional regulator [Steroidobacteraceae bacterium]
MRQRSLDERDLALLARLRLNARESLTRLSLAIGLSRSALQERLRRLERDGVIERYTIVTRSATDDRVRAWLTVRLQPGVKCAQVAPQILRQTAVVTCHALAGDIDLLVLINAVDVGTLSKCRELVAALPGVAAVETHPVLASYLEPVSKSERR